MSLFRRRLPTFSGTILKQREDVVSLDDLRGFVHDPPSRNSLWRWCIYGKVHPYSGKRIKLEAIQGTRGLMSSAEAYYRFLERINQ